MRKLFFCILILSGNAVSGQLSDSIKYAIKAECFARLERDQMKEVPEYFSQRNDSLNKIRAAYFIENFRWLVETTKQYGFPSHRLLYTPADSLRPKDFYHWQVFPSMTILHIFQTAPKMLVTDDVVQLFKDEIDMGNMKRNVISDALDFYTDFSTPCNDDEEKVNRALVTWGIAPLDTHYFKDCGK